MTVFLAVISGCAGASKTPEQKTDQGTDVKNLMAQLNSRLDQLESKVATLNDKQEASRSALDNVLNVQKPQTAAVKPHPSEMTGAPVEPPRASNNPDAGFVNDNAVKNYRQAMVLFQAQKYPEAMLAFSSFLERFADHPLAGSAQFYVGESYFRQKEYKLALQEYQRVLTSYDRSPFVADTLRQMAATEDALKRPDDAARHRQLLLSLFPNSPAAARLVDRASREGSLKPSAAAAAMDPAPAAPTATSEDANTKIKQAVTEVISKTNLGGSGGSSLDEPPPTAPAPEQSKTIPAEPKKVPETPEEGAKQTE